MSPKNQQGSKDNIVELAIGRCFWQTIIDPEIILQPKNFNVTFFETLEDYIGSGLRMIYNHVIKEETEAIYPSDWWQAFKERWFPYWLLHRYPVRYTEIVAKHLFPEAAIPQLGKEILHVVKKEVYEFRSCPARRIYKDDPD